MLDPDRALVSALMRDGEGGFTKLNSAGFSPELVVGEEAQKSLAFILAYHKKYAQLPTVDAFHEGTGLYLDPCQEPLLAIRDELINRRIIDTVKSGSDEVGKAMASKDGVGAIAALEAILFQIRKQQLTGGKVDSIFKMGPAVLAYYDDIKAGKRGVPLPWPTLTEQTLGLWPEDVAMFVARLGVGKCVSAGTRVADPVTGLYRPIEEVVAEKCSVVSFDRTSGIGPKRPTAWIPNGQKECIELRTRLGHRLTLTPEHLMLTSSGWVRADRIPIGDCIVAMAHAPEPTEPVAQNLAELELLAVLLADGNLTKKGTITFTKTDPTLVANAPRVAKALGLEVTPRSKAGTYGVVPAAQVEQILERLEVSMALSKVKYFPDAVYRLSNEQLRRFLMVFWWCDGGKDACIGLASERMIDDLQRLLLRFGVVTRKRFKLAKCDDKEFDSWELRVEAWCLGRFKALMADMPGEKGVAIAALRDSSNPNTDNVPVTDEMIEAFKTAAIAYRRLDCPAKDRRGLFSDAGATLGRASRQTGLRDFTFKNGKRSVGRKALRVLLQTAGPLLADYAWMGRDDIVFDTLVSRKSVGVRTVYDVTVPETECFIAENLVAHNSWMAIMLALSAYESGNKVLFVTTEMSKLRIAMRMYSIKLKIGYDDISKARLPPWQEAIFREKVDGLLESPLFDIIGGDFDFSLGAYRAAIEESQPKLVVLDGAYLIKADGKNRSEQMATAMNEIKRIGVQLKVPQALTSQFNRDVKSNSPNTVDNGAIALSDVAGWNATLIVGMVQTDAMKKDRRMILKPLKMREGSGEDLEANWCFQTMNFSEISSGSIPNAGVPVPPGSPDPDPAVASDQSLLF